MSDVKIGGETFRLQWASDINLDGIRLEALDSADRDVFNLTILEDGPPTLNTFGREAPVALVLAAIAVGRTHEDWTD